MPCPNLLRNPNVGFRVKQQKKERVRAHSLALNILGVRGRAKAQRWTKMNSQTKFKIKSTCTTKKRKQLVQVECKWCNILSKNNLKHKLYTAHNL